MLYHLYKRRRGKEQLLMTDELSKVNDRLKTLRKGARGGLNGERTDFYVRPAEDGEQKFYKERMYRNGREH